MVLIQGRTEREAVLGSRRACSAAMLQGEAGGKHFHSINVPVSLRASVSRSGRLSVSELTVIADIAAQIRIVRSREPELAGSAAWQCRSSL